MGVVVVLLLLVVLLLVVLLRENKVKPNCQLSYQLELVGVVSWTRVGLGFDKKRIILRGHLTHSTFRGLIVVVVIVKTQPNPSPTDNSNQL